MTLEQATNVAIIILVLEAFVVGFIPLAMYFVVVRAMQRLLPKIRRWLLIGQGWVLVARSIVSTLMHWLLEPILICSGLRAGLGAGARALRRR